MNATRSTSVQVMAWCRQATSHYLSQCWPRSMSPYGVTRPQWVNIINLLAPGRWGNNLKSIIFNLALAVTLKLKWMVQIYVNEKSTLVQVMAWCRQATSHYLSQCLPRSKKSCGVTKPIGHNELTHWVLNKSQNSANTFNCVFLKKKIFLKICSQGSNWQ